MADRGDFACGKHPAVEIGADPAVIHHIANARVVFAARSGRLDVS